MGDSDDDIPALDIDDDEAGEDTRRPNKEKTTEIPNFKGKVPDAADKDDSKGTLQIDWDGDQLEDSQDETDSESEEVPEGEVGEEFAKARREALREKREKRLAEEEGSDEEVVEEEDLWNFPPDKYNWQEEDLGEEWADAWPQDEKTGFDPDLVDDWDELERLWKKGEGPPARPFYVPYRKHYPLIPEDHPDIQTPQDVVEELDRYEEFLTWNSSIFKDGSSYEGTVFDDLAHGKGVYTTALELCKYEGEWLQNAMEGHGVLEAHIPVIEPPPDSEAAKKMKAEGKLLSTDFMPEEDREWIKMDVEDKMEMGDVIVDPNPMEDDEAWVKIFGEKPEKGRYRYAGQWKHSRMHGCGVLEVNENQLSGQFYFGELLPGDGNCDEDQVAIHSGLAEIAAAKARMFVLKPDGMVREYRGPYTDPSHPYMYDEADMWMAPGFINAFYKVPDIWQRYVEEVDEEREMWLNSFIKSPFRIPMPPELEYQWAKDDEFILLSNQDSNPLYQYPENLDPEVQGEILLHTPTGNLINWAEDPDGNLRFFLQPRTEDGVIRPEEAIPLPLGFDEFMGLVDEEGNPIEESRRGLSVDERKKLQEQDAKNARKKKAKEKLEAKLEEMRAKSREKIKEMETDMYIRELERKVEDALLEERFEAELEAAEEEDEEDVVEEEEKGKGADAGSEEASPSAKGEQPSSSLGDEAEGVDNAVSRKEDEGDEADEGSGSGSGADGDDEDEDEDDGGEGDDDEDDNRPQSFGKVAMATIDVNEKDKHSSGDGPSPPFPTVFASISLVPQMAAKHLITTSSSMRPRAWVSRLTDFCKRFQSPKRELEQSSLRSASCKSESFAAAEILKSRCVALPKSRPVKSLALRSSCMVRALSGDHAQRNYGMAKGSWHSALKAHQYPVKSTSHRVSTVCTSRFTKRRKQVLQAKANVSPPDTEVLFIAIPVGAQ